MKHDLQLGGLTIADIISASEEQKRLEGAYQSNKGYDVKDSTKGCGQISLNGG